MEKPRRSPLVLFGAQSGCPTEADAVRALETARAAGYTDFMVYARSGLECEYMGEEWLALVGHYLRHAKRLGMGIWLYDEFNWPSGSCRGRVTAENPEFANSTCAIYLRNDGSLDWRFFRAQSISANVFDAEAMARFRALTHEVYEERFREYFGTVIRGIFTDEPGSAHWMEIPPGDLVNFRWYRGLEADYRIKTGRDFREDVKTFCREVQKSKSQGVKGSENAVGSDLRADRGAGSPKVQKSKSPKVKGSEDAVGSDLRADRTRVWEDYTAVLGHAFRRAFTDPATAWANRLGIVSSGHLMNESGPYGAANCNGMTLHVLKGMSKPGVDDIFTRTSADKVEWLTLASVQHACDRTRRPGMAELFALGPADLAFDRMLQQIWLFALHKVDTFLLALHFLTPHGFIEKPHYAMFFTPLQPWFPDQEAFHDGARVAAAFARKPFRYDVAARYRECAAGRIAIAGGERRSDLLDLLRALESHQFAVNLAEEDEPCEESIVFDFDDAGIFDERSGRRFASAEEALGWLAERSWLVPERGRLVRPGANADGPSAPRQMVALEGGERASDLVLRRYEDGTAALLNLRDEDRALVFVADGARIPFTLPGRGTWIYRPAASEWSLSLDCGNRRRIRFLADGTARISMASPTRVRFALCDLPAARAAVTLDGAPLAGTLPCSFLGFGYDGTYRETGPVDLAAGEHVFTCSGREDRGLFLPVLWMEGGFSVREPGEIGPLPDRVPCGPLASVGLADFAGKATYRADVDVPEDAEAIELGTGHAMASVRLGGRDLGTRIAAPWRYAVPADLRGSRQSLEITVTTSVRPMFGAESDTIPGAHPSNKPAWVKTIPGESDTGLLWTRWA